MVGLEEEERTGSLQDCSLLVVLDDHNLQQQGEEHLFDRNHHRSLVDSWAVVRQKVGRTEQKLF